MPDPLPEMPLPGENSRLYRIGVMLLNGYGYNWYRQDNRMRADDLLIRSRASEHLASAAAALRDREGRFRRKYLPPPTRQHPDPDPQQLAAVQQFRAVVDRILDIDTKVRGGAVPSEDKIWLRHRDEIDLAPVGRVRCDPGRRRQGAGRRRCRIARGCRHRSRRRATDRPAARAAERGADPTRSGPVGRAAMIGATGHRGGDLLAHAHGLEYAGRGLSTRSGRME